MCPYYDELDPVMKDRPASSAAYTNEMTDNDNVDTDSDNEDDEEESNDLDQNESDVLVEHNVNVLDALEKSESTNTEVGSSSSSTPLTKHDAIVTLSLSPSKKDSNSSDENDENKKNDETTKCVVDVCRSTPLRKKQRMNRVKNHSKQSGCTITDTKNKKDMQIMPESVAKYYEERSSSLKSKDKRAAEKHSIEMKTEKFKLMMDLIKHGVATDLADARVKINSNLFK